MYAWVALLYSRNWHNIVNRLYFNFKNVKRKKCCMLFFSLRYLFSVRHVALYLFLNCNIITTTLIMIMLTVLTNIHIYIIQTHHLEYLGWLNSSSGNPNTSVFENESSMRTLYSSST